MRLDMHADLLFELRGSADGFVILDARSAAEMRLGMHADLLFELRGSAD
jgi:hypothetical protein